MDDVDHRKKCIGAVKKCAFCVDVCQREVEEDEKSENYDHQEMMTIGRSTVRRYEGWLFNIVGVFADGGIGVFEDRNIRVFDGIRNQSFILLNASVAS